MDGNCCARPAHVVRHADLCAVDLALAGRAPELLDDLADLLDAGRTDRVAAGLEAAARVHRDLPAKSGFAIGSEFPGRSLLAEAEVLDGADLCNREAVVHLDHVDVVRGQVCHLERTLAGRNRRVQSRDVAPVVQRDRVAGLSGREYLNRRVRELAGPVSGATITAAAPSVTGEQSKSRRGSATIVDFSTVSSVISLWNCAIGFRAPLKWFFTATCASCSRVMWYLCM